MLNSPRLPAASHKAVARLVVAFFGMPAVLINPPPPALRLSTSVRGVNSKQRHFREALSEKQKRMMVMMMLMIIIITIMTWYDKKKDDRDE